ncbi:MAG: sensor histidine kinase [Bacteroidales bacterium]
MKNKTKLTRLILTTLIILLLAVAAETLYNSSLEYKVRTKRFNRILKTKETIMEECLASLKSLLEKGEEIGSISKSDINNIIREKEITVLEYLDGKLVHWTDNSFDVPTVYDDTLFSKPFVFIHNGWFIPKQIQTGRERIIALLRVRSEYGFENNLVRNGFNPAYKVPIGTGLSFDEGKSQYGVFSNQGIKLFTLTWPAARVTSWFTFIPAGIWIIAFILIILLTLRILKLIAEKGKYILALLLSALLFMSYYCLILISAKPEIITETKLFSGYLFSYGKLIPSLGHLLILSILLVMISYVFYDCITIKPAAVKNNKQLIFFLSFLLTGGAVILTACHNIIAKLVFDSNIVFEPYRVLELSSDTLAGYITILLLMTVPALYLIKILKEVQSIDKPAVLPASLAVPVIFFVLTALISGHDIFPLIIFFVVLVQAIWFSLRKRIILFNITVFISLFVGLYILYYVIKLSEEKSVEQKKVLAVAYSTEHDPEAEHLLIDMWPKLSADSLLRKMVSKEFTTQNEIDSITYYLHNTYFAGYWGNFNLSVVSCRHDSPLWISSEEKMIDNCFTFFRERVEKYGHQITGTEFYFLEGQGGRSYYLGEIYYDADNNVKKGLFIELYNDVDSFQEGYSELLLDKKYQGYSRLKYYSFAKYINGFLVLRTGDFPYDKTDEAYVEREYDYRVFNSEKFKHVLYRSGNVTVIISSERISFVDVLISFAYIFAFTLLIVNIVLLFIRRPGLKSIFYLNFRQKLQISFITVLLISFISVGVIVAVFSVNQYKTRHLENIKEKINSIYTELESHLAAEPDLGSDWRDATSPSLNEFLIRLSNVFNTDINLYDRNGYLMATSRPEVFYRNLTSRRLNMDAFINLENLTKSEYIQREKIVSLEYLSAYLPFYNEAGNLLAYLNLPYFRMESVLTRQISNVIVVVINFTLLIIIITMIIAVLISRGLTAPLRMLSEGLASVQLGKKSEHLVYDGRDEIGEMVNQYNRMVDELQESARRLADSEREYAWREMAKQIAHEIKNPLTPMKLNIQQLYKSWKDGKPGFEKKLEKFTRNQIENIETLSSIASAFSTFAKMPSANPVNVNLIDQIKTTLELFKDTENVSFRVNWPVNFRIVVFADKEHLNSIFSNLIKNAIQSIPQGRAGMVKINMELRGDKAIVSVADNGTGIPDELKIKLFTPNFTTKSSGMGLGLSIVKRYAESMGGRVWFQSEKDKGSVFFVELPVNFTVEKLGQV